MKSALLILAAYQMTATVDTDNRYVSKTTKEAIEKVESAVCGTPPGYYGLVSNPVFVDVTAERPHNCKLVVPDGFRNGD